jgi:hypothetical protein
MGGVGNNIYEASFVSSAGTQVVFLTETSVSYPNGEGGQDVPLFLGWVGAPGELLEQIILAPPVTGILVDNTRAYEVAPPSPPVFSKVFAPDTIAVGGTSTLTFTIDNTANAAVLTGLNFTDTFPAGVQVASPLNIGGTCGGITTTAIAGGASFDLTSATIGASATCTVNVDVTGTTTGSKVNTTGVLGSTETGTGTDTATDTLTVVGGLVLTKSFTDDPVPSGGTVTLEFMITNPDGANAATAIGFTDDLDAALSGLAATGLPASDVCGAGSQFTGTSLLTLTGANLAAGASCTFSVSIQVPPNTSGTYTNTTSQITGTIATIVVIGPAATDTLEVTDTVQLTKEVIRNFMIQRADLITSQDPLLTSHLNSSGAQPITAPSM